jgi:hypothetical protein
MGEGPNYIEFTSLYSMNLLGFYVDSAASYSRWDRDIVCSVIGDSISGSVATYFFDTNWHGILCNAIGAEQRNYAIGGSGWFSGDDNQGLSTAFRARIPFAASGKPDIHFWFGGVNDDISGATREMMRAEVNYCIGEFARLSPKTKQVVIGLWRPPDGGSVALDHNEGMRLAAVDSDVEFIDLLTSYRRDDIRSYTPPAVANGASGMWVDSRGIGWSFNHNTGNSTRTSLITPENNAAYINLGAPPHPTLAGQQALAARVIGALLGP